jgi:hypothetical protein
MGIMSITIPRSRSMEGMRVLGVAVVRGLCGTKGAAVDVTMYER